MSRTVELQDEYSSDPLSELKVMLGKDWQVSKEGNRFVCKRDGKIYHTSGVLLGQIYKSTLLSIAFAARQAYGSRW